MSAYIPDSRHIVWLQFDPQAGHEAGHRPALVLSPAMMSRCPMTSRIKGYPFEVVVSDQPPSAVLSDQIKSLEWRARKAVYEGQAPPMVLAEAQAKIRALLCL